MITRSILLLSLAPALLLGGCGGTLNRSVESAHQPVVARNDYVFDVGTAGDGLAPGEERRLAGWMDSMRLGYGDHVAVDDPTGDRAARVDIAQMVARYGLLLAEDAPVTGAALTPGTIRVVVSRSSASVPRCPDYTRMGGTELDSNTSSNFGCAINANLAAMVADPADLVRGEAGDTTTDQAVSSKAIDSFRKAPPSGASGLKAETTGASK